MPLEFSPDLIFYNGNIVTVDPQFSVVEALAVYDRKVVARGSSGEVRALAGSSTKEIDLKGRCVVPGQMDNHAHLPLAGLNNTVKLNVAGEQSIEGVLRIIEEKVKVTSPGDWIATSNMYRGTLKEGRFPNRHDLDKVSPENPVYIFQSGKNIITNSYGLRLAEIDRETPHPTEPEGWIVQEENGDPTGHLIGGAGDLARMNWWKAQSRNPSIWEFMFYDFETHIKAMKAQQKIFHACGVVGVREMGTSVDELDAFIEMHRRGELKIRTDVILGLPHRYMTIPELDAAISSYFGPKQHLGDDMLKLGGIKFVVVNDGWWAYSPEKLKFLIRAYNRRGWQMAFHINTGGAGEGEGNSTEMVISLLEEADKERPLEGRRISFEHGLGLENPDHYMRAKKLGISIAANPLLIYYAAARSMRMHEIMEQVRIAKMTEKDPWKRTVRDWGMPIKDWLEAGVHVTGGSDVPAVAYDPERPFLSQYVALTGDTMAGVLLPGQEITREQMLRMYTINIAHSCFQENIRGSLEIGKLADMTVLDRDILTCPVEDLRDKKIVLETYVGGELVFERGA